MRIVLTGGTGFIGSHFLNAALAEGHDVLAIRRTTTSFPRISLLREPLWLDANLNEVKGVDLKGYDVLVHLATHTGNVPYDSLANCLKWNLMAPLELFEQARDAGIQNFIVAGSCFEYGISGEKYSEIPTNAPLEPTNSYAASKAAASIAFQQWASQSQLNLCILRVFHVFGEGELPSRFWPSLKRAAFANDDFKMSKGDQIRDFMYVKDVAKAFLDCAKHVTQSKYLPKVINLSSGKSTSMRDFALTWWDKWGASGDLKIGTIPYRQNEVMRFVPGENLFLIGDTSHA